VRAAAPLLLAALLAPAPRAGAGDEAPPPPLKVVARIPLPGVKGRIDHMAVDGAGGRLFLACIENDTVEVVDLKARERVQTLEGIGGAAGVAWLPGPKRLAASSGRDGTLLLFEGDKELKKVGSVALGEDADNVRPDPDGKRVWVGSGDGALSAVDGERKERVLQVPLPGHPEAFELDPSGPRVFVNVPTAGKVVVVDREKKAIVKEIPLEGAARNFPLALDAARRRLFVGCRKPARVLVLDTETGATAASLEGPGDVDDLFLDDAKGRLYASGGDGTVAVFERGEGDRWRALAPVKTAPGARTSLWVTAMRTLFVAAPKRGDSGAAILVLEAAP
jgi:DNA-binding beta-propeller fold protein YncE